jgi:KTSC domain-containing protein
MIRSVGFDATRLILEIEFGSKKIYQYESVPEHVYRELVSADSKGRFFEREINRKYACRQI